MAVFLTRAFDLDPGPDPVFTDVAPDAWYYDQVAALAASGITAGCGDGTTFCPHQQTTRAQMATFLARATGLVETPTATPTQPSQTYKGRHRRHWALLCHSNRQHHHLLGSQRLRAGRRARGHLQDRHRRHWALLCHSNRQHHHLLGSQRLEPSRICGERGG